MADSITDKLKNVRTLEDIVNLLTILFTNLNNQNEIYYDMFLNPNPMDIELQRYNENGELVTVTLANRAKDRILSYSGSGSPNGVQVATVGSLYIDTEEGSLYFKAGGTDAYGWVLVWTSRNFTEGNQYISPTGDASNLTNLNMSNAGSGTLPVARGGSGVSSITGIIKGNGTAPYSALTDNDMLPPSELAGMISFYPVETLPPKCLVCDGTIYSTVYRPELTRLCSILGNKYGGDGITSFGVPNLIDKYIKCGIPSEVGTIGEAHVGEHTHGLSGDVGYENRHVHDPGTLNSIGSYTDQWALKSSPEGVFSLSDTGNTYSTSDSALSRASKVKFELANGWVDGCNTGEGSAHTHSLDNMITEPAGSGVNEVDHIVMVPIIRW